MQNDSVKIICKKKQPYKLYTFYDIILIILLLLSGILIFPAISSSSPSTAAIYIDNKLIAQYPLNSDRNIKIKGHQGTVRLNISNGKVGVTSSTCPKQICKKTGNISLPHQQIICAPNHLLVEIKSRRGKKIDAVTK